MRGTGPAMNATERVLAVLRRQPNLPGDPAAQTELAKGFVERMKQRQPLAAEMLQTGRMAPEELESRISVFLADRRAETAMHSDSAIASRALESFSERFILTNFGRPAERVHSLALRGTAEEGGRRREFVLFRQHPNRARLHYVENGVVVTALGFDGKNAWRQDAAGRAVFLSGNEARALRELADYDHPLIDAETRHTSVRLLRGDIVGRDLVEVELDRGEFGKMVSKIDPVTAEERVVVRFSGPGTSAGSAETRLSDYHRHGSLNLPHKQETWEGGQLKRTVLIERIDTEPGFVSQFFTRPDTGQFAFMDLMGAFEVVRRKQAATPAGNATPGAATPPAPTTTGSVAAAPKVVAGGTR